MVILYFLQTLCKVRIYKIMNLGQSDQTYGMLPYVNVYQVGSLGPLYTSDLISAHQKISDQICFFFRLSLF